MLKLEIQVPATSNTYEFIVNENVRVPVLIDEVAHVVSAKEACEWDGDLDGLLLCDAERGLVLPLGKTLYECGVSPGSRLVMV